MIKTKNVKKAYIITCSSIFRDQINLICRKKKVNAGDIARSIILTTSSEIIEQTPDPGEPNINDRETYFIKTDLKNKNPKKRKPRIQLRLPEGLEISFIRKTLHLAILLNKKNSPLFKTDNEENHKKVIEENEKLKAIIIALSPEPVAKHVTNQAEAFYILGFPPYAKPTENQIKQKYRMLAMIHHPDGELGSHEQMRLLNDAFSFLKKNYKA